jgi:hypothetical protein
MTEFGGFLGDQVNRALGLCLDRDLKGAPPARDGINGAIGAAHPSGLGFAIALPW